jgi:hypothetical protein
MRRAGFGVEFSFGAAVVGFGVGGAAVGASDAGVSAIISP